MAFLAELAQGIGQRLFFEIIDHIGGARPGFRHPHVERTVAAERKSARRIVDLRRGHTKIQNDTVERRRPGRIQQAAHITEASLQQGQPVRIIAQQGGAPRDRVRIPVQREQRAVGGVQDGSGIATGAEGPVKIDLSVARPQSLQHLVAHDRYMDGRGHDAGSWRGGGNVKPGALCRLSRKYTP